MGLLWFQDELKNKRQEKEEQVKLMIDSVAAEELDNLRRKHKSLLEENNDLSVKVAYLMNLLNPDSGVWKWTNLLSKVT